MREIESPELATRPLRLRRDVRFRVIDREAVVLRQEAAEALVINEVGARILQLTDGETPLEHMLDQLNAEFDVDRDELRRDCEEFVQNLQEIGVLEAVEAEPALAARKAAGPRLAL